MKRQVSHTTRTSEVLSDRDRLREIGDLDLVSDDIDPELQAIVTRAALRFGLPVSCVTVVLDEAQFFAAAYGLGGWLGETRGSPVEWSFCRVAVETREPFVVEDTTVHPITRDNPLVHSEGIRCYAGAPMISTGGHALGALCVAGGEARHFSDRDIADLRALAAEVVEHVETRW